MVCTLKTLHLVPGIGIVYGLLSSFFFTINVVLIKKVSSIHPCQIACSRCVIQILLTLPLLTFKWYDDKLDIIGPKNRRLLLLCRGITGSTAMIFLYLSVGKIPVADAVTISFTNTMYVCLIACIFLGEAFTILDGILIVFSVAGIVLIAQPPFIFGGSTVNYSENVSGICFAIGTSLLAAITFNIIRKLGRKTHYLLNLYSYSMFGSITSGSYVAIFGLFTMPCLSEINILLIIGITGFFGQVFLILSLQTERAGTVSILKSTQIIMTFIFQVSISVIHTIHALYY